MAKKSTPAKNIHADHRQRVRDRYRKQGLENFADHEVLEFLLFYCYPRCNTNEIAHNMLEKFGTLHNLFEADVDTLMQTLDCTENVAVFITLMPAMLNMYYRSKWRAGKLLDDEKIAGSFAIDLFAGQTVEKFYIVCLDKGYRLINTALISTGTVDESAVYPREIIRAALKNNATAIILAHNHPGGSFNPSRNDLETTRRIIEVANPLGISVVDHIIVCGDTYYSFAVRRQHVKGYF